MHSNGMVDAARLQRSGIFCVQLGACVKTSSRTRLVGLVPLDNRSISATTFSASACDVCCRTPRWLHHLHV